MNGSLKKKNEEKLKKFADFFSKNGRCAKEFTGAFLVLIARLVKKKRGGLNLSESL